jgi:hypothetical protein
MNRLKPKEQHEQLLANADKALIMQYLQSGSDRDVTKISVMLARQCDLFVHFQRLWKMRVADLGEKLNSEEYMKNIYTNKRALYKELIKSTAPK